MNNASLKLCGAVILATVLAAPAYAGCKQGYCMKGSWDGDVRRVDFSTDMSGFTHFNVNNGQRQIELGRNERSFVVHPTGFNPVKFRYAIQACNKGGAFSKSNCSPWVTFTHTEK